MKCAHCGKNADQRPIRTEAICWPCWYDAYGKQQAINEWKSKRWWRRFVP